MDAFAGAFTLGVLSAASPCLLPLYPGFIAYLASNSRTLAGRSLSGLLGLVVLAGVLSAMLAVGLVLAVVAVPIGRVLGYLIPLVDAAIVALGLLLLAGRNPFERLPGMRVPIVGGPFRQAYVYGLLLGPLALPCAGSFIVALFAISVGVADAVPRVARFLVYGLGFGLPLVLLSLVAGARQQTFVRFIAGRHAVIERLAGLVLVAVGAWDFTQNWQSIRLTFGL